MQATKQQVARHYLLPTPYRHSDMLQKKACKLPLPPCSALSFWPPATAFPLTCARGSSSAGQRTSSGCAGSNTHASWLGPLPPPLMRLGRTSCTLPWKRAPSYKQTRARCAQGLSSGTPVRAHRVAQQGLEGPGS